jgi:hypothetical protein
VGIRTQIDHLCIWRWRLPPVRESLMRQFVAAAVAAAGPAVTK